MSAEIVPSVGAGLARFDWKHTPLLRSWPKGGSMDCMDLACNLLLPWSNRISGGGFRFDDVFYKLLPNLPGESYPIHGNGLTSAWTVDEVEADAVILSLASDGPVSYTHLTLPTKRIV